MVSTVERLLSRLRLASRMPNPERSETTTQYEALATQRGQDSPRLVEERAAVQVNQEGRVNGQNVQTQQIFTIRVRRDLFPDPSTPENLDR